MENYIIPVLYSVAAANLLLSFVIFSRGLSNVKNITFALISLASAIWSISIISFYSPEFSKITNWLVFTHISAVSISFIFFYFSILFPKKLIPSLFVRLFASLPFIYIVYEISFTDKIIGKVTEGLSYEIGSGYILYCLILVSYFMAGYVFLYTQYKKTENELQKKQIYYVLFGSFLASTSALVPDLILPYFKTFDYTWLGPIFTSIMVISVFIGMFKYQLFNIKVILTELFAGLIVVLLLTELFFSKSTPEILIKGSVLIIVSIFSYLLIKGVYKEINQREQIEKLAGELKKTNNDLGRANDKLKELDQLKSEFVSLATHQIRGPLAATKGYASMILEGDFGKVPESLKEPVDKIFQSCQSLVMIVEDFLNISRIEQGRMKYTFSEFDMSQLVENVVAEMRPVIEKAGLKIHFVKKGNRDFKITADQGKIRQVVGNLIDNATKYTPKGEIFVNISHKEEDILFEVKDNGVGISEETIPKLFQKFSRAKDANKTNNMGTGLGLYVVSEMVKSHGGKIWAESEGEGKGASFFVELKAKQ